MARDVFLSYLDYCLFFKYLTYIFEYSDTYEMSELANFLSHLFQDKGENDSFYLKNLVYHLNLNFILFFLFYTFFQALVLSIFIELFWPTHYFNQKFKYLSQSFSFRSFTSYLNKMYLFSSFSKIYYKFITRFYFK